MIVISTVKNPRSCLVPLDSRVKVTHLQACHSLNIQHNGMWKTKKTFKWHSAGHVLVPEKSTPSSTSCIWKSGKNYIMKDHIHIKFSKFNTLYLGPWVGSWNSAIGFMHTIICIVTSYSLTRHSSHTTESTILEIPISGLMKTHKEL